MPSTIIHLCVAKEVNETLHREKKDFYIGSIAPDIGKIVGIGKAGTHFSDVEDTTPKVDRFLKKYKDKLHEDFTLGYFIHLYTDYLWEKYFVTDFVHDGSIFLNNGDEVPLAHDLFLEYLYNDYTDMNIKLIEFYDLDLGFLFNDRNGIETSIEEVPKDKIKDLFDKSIEILEASKNSKNYVFDIREVSRFIEFVSPIIIDELKRIEES